MDPDPYLNVLSQILIAVLAASDLITVYAPSIGGIVAIVIALIALGVSAFVSGSETAYFSLTDSDVESVEDENLRERIGKILSKPQILLATILITNNLVNVSIVILLNYAFSEIFVFHSDVADFIFKSVILTFLLLLFGEILPKLYSNNHSLKWAKFAVSGITLLSRIFAPVSKLMAMSTSVVNKVVTKKSDDLSLDDLSHALEITEVNEEKTMLKEILKFGGKTVSEVMTPRVDITDVEWDTTFNQLLSIIKESGYSRMPVYLESKDNVKGIIYAKDLLPYIGSVDDSFQWQSLVRKPFFVPESRMIDDILEDFRKKKIHMAIVVDEYGGTQGLVTLEDVLEEIVGEINDEYDEDEKFYTRLSPDTYVFQGKTQLNDFYRVTGLEASDFDGVAEDAETVAGLLLNIKHDFPGDKETIEYGRCRFIVLDVAKFRINSVKVKVAPKDDAKKGEDDEQER